MSIQIGNLKSRLRHQIRQEAATPGGGQTVTWTDQDLIRCSLVGESGSEQLVAGGVQYVNRFMVKMRWRADVVPRNRLKRETDGLVLEILAAVDPDGDQRKLNVTCAQVI